MDAFTVLEFGYKKIIPELVGGNGGGNEMAETLRIATDFAVVNSTTKDVRLIKV